MPARGFDPYEEAKFRATLRQTADIQRAPSYGEYNPQTEDDYGFSIKNFDAAEFDSEEEYAEYLEGSTNTGPAALTDKPTSSTNSARPRTVAAGYQQYVGAKKMEQPLGKMTVLFRDGTLYNYYDVTPGEWQNFSASISKGSPWLNRGFPNGKQQVDGLFIGKPQGPADISQAPAKIRQNIYNLARTAQVRFKNPSKTKSGNERKVSVKMYAPDYRESGKTFRASFTGVTSRKAALRRKGYGKNPTK